MAVNLSKSTLGFIGAGSMAEALAKGVISAGLFDSQRIVASDISAERRRVFESLGASATEKNMEVVRRADIVVLAVKPQKMNEVLDSIRNAAGGKTLFVSIAAGIRTAAIEKKLRPGIRVVRVMPNTPLMLRKGAAGIAPGARSSAEDLDTVAAIFRAVCDAVIMLDEDLIDAVTAVSGSGPAYVFALVEAMVQAGVAEGLSEEDALALSVATVAGTAEMLRRTGEQPAELRRRVTSPGGTTQAAFDLLAERKVHDALVAAVRRAAERSRELGK